ncbi:MAG: TonB family protein, partial [Bacteroidota bacterium]
MLDFTFSGTEVLLGLTGLSALVGLTIYVLRRRLHRKERADTTKHAVFSFTTPLHRLSLCVAILASLITLNWTEVHETPVYASNMIMEDDLIEVDIPPTMHQPPPPPPPPPPVIEAVAEPELEPTTFENQDITPEEPIFNFAPAPPPAPASAPPPPPLPPEPEVVIDDGPLIFAERMPVFGKDCFDLPGEERKICSDRALLSFVQSRVNYPPLARENGIQGTVVVSFTVEKDGTISDIMPVREVGGGCTAAAVKAITAINEEGATFKPG